MVSLKEVDAQLEKVGLKNRFFGRPEVRELCHILAPGETITHAVNGQYEGGFALMLTTDRRILLIDKKPWFLTMEDIRYDMVSEVDFYARLLDASVALITISKKLNFTSWRQDRLRKLVKYIQHRVMQLRQMDQGQNQWQQEPAQPMAASPIPSQFSQQPRQLEPDFAGSYQAKIKQHSMAHVAGQLAMAERPKQIIRPLYPRPSLVTKYRHGGVARQAAASSRSSI